MSQSEKPSVDKFLEYIKAGYVRGGVQIVAARSEFRWPVFCFHRGALLVDRFRGYKFQVDVRCARCGEELGHWRDEAGFIREIAKREIVAHVERAASDEARPSGEAK